MYTIVKIGGHQEKVEAGDVIFVNCLDAKKGDTVELPVSLVVNGSKATLTVVDPARVSIKAGVMNDETKDPETSAQKYKNKTGVARCRGHRQKLIIVKIMATVWAMKRTMNHGT